MVQTLLKLTGHILISEENTGAVYCVDRLKLCNINATWLRKRCDDRHSMFACIPQKNWNRNKRKILKGGEGEGHGCCAEYSIDRST